MKKLIVAVLTGLVLIIVAGLIAVPLLAQSGFAEKFKNNGDDSGTKVRIVDLVRGDLTRTINAPGTIEPIATGPEVSIPPGTQTSTTSGVSPLRISWTSMVARVTILRPWRSVRTSRHVPRTMSLEPLARSASVSGIITVAARGVASHVSTASKVSPRANSRRGETFTIDSALVRTSSVRCRPDDIGLRRCRRGALAGRRLFPLF